MTKSPLYPDDADINVSPSWEFIFFFFFHNNFQDKDLSFRHFIHSHISTCAVINCNYSLEPLAVGVFGSLIYKSTSLN